MGKTILLVEDEAIIALAESNYLRKEGYSIVTAKNGFEAVEKACSDADRIDLILMDINLGPGMDGTEAAREILKERDVPVLFLSSHTEKDIVEKTEKITSYGYVVKNTSGTVLNASIKMAFKLFEANKRIQEKNTEIGKAYEKMTAINEALARSKKDLMTSEAQYRLLADNMSDTIWLMDMNLKTVYISPSVQRTRGFTLEELNGMPLEAHVTVDSFERAMALFAEALSQENLNRPEPRANFSMELEFFRKDKSTFWSDIAFTLIFDQNGKPANILGAGRDVTERKLAEEKLKESETRLSLTLEAAGIGIWDWDVGHDRYVASPIYYTMLGYAQKNGLADRGEWLERLHPDDKELVNEQVRNVLSRTCKDYSYEARFRHADGAYRWQYVRGFGVEVDADGKIIRMLGIRMDIDQRKKAEEAKLRMNREIRAVSECNQALLRATDEQSLLDDICGIICEKAGYRMAWVGYAEQDDGKTVRAAAQAGFDEGFLEKSNITWADDTAYGHEPSGTAIRSGKPACVQYFVTDNNASPWRENALKRGYRSCAALPLKDENSRTFGVLTIYSAESDSFTCGEMRLLEELAGDLAFGITTLRIRKERDAAMRELQTANDLLNAIIEAAPTAVIGLDLDGRVHTVWNKAAEKMLGWSAHEVMGKYLPSVPQEKEEEFTRFRELIRQGKTLNGLDVRRQRRDGTPIDYSIFASPLHNPLGEINGNVAVMVDITERKRMEVELRKSERYKSIMNRIQNIFLSVDDDGMYGLVLEVLLEVFDSKLGIFGYIAENGNLVIPSLTVQAWDECRVPDKSIVFPSVSWGDSLWGRALRERKSFKSDGPFHTPPGHVRIGNFLTAPVLFGNNVIGIVSVANGLNGYTDGDEELLVGITVSISPILHARLQRDRHEREKRLAEKGLRRANRALRVLSEGNHAIARAATEPEMLREICRVIVESGDYLATWIGLADQDESGTVRPAASAGFDEGYFELMSPSWADVGFDRSPIGTAILEGKTTVCRDVAGAACFEPWRAEVIKRGFASTVAIPIRTAGGIFGAIGIYAAETGAFDASETDLLEELIGDLSLGLEVLNAKERRLNAEEALRLSETKYRIVADNTFDWEFWLEPGRRFQYNSLSCERITGYPASDFEKDPELLARIIHPDDWEAFLRHNAEVTEKRETGGMVFRVVRPDGAVRWVEHLCKPVFAGGGKFMGNRGSNRDITERVQNDNILHARLRLLEFAGAHSMDETLTAVLDELETLTGSSIGFYHFLEDDQKTLLLQNWSSNTLKTMCTAEGKGRHYDVEQAGVWVDCVHDRRPVIHNDYAALTHRKGTPEGHARVIREAVVPIFRGNLIKAVVGVGNKSSCYTDDDVAVISKLGDLSWDIVELKHAEEVLKDSEARFRSIYENIPLGYQSLDSDGNILDVNRAWLGLLGYERNEVVGRWFGEFMTPDQATVFRVRFAWFLSEGHAVSEFEMKRRDGARVFFSFIGRTERDIHGRFVRTHCIVSDITSKRNEETAVRAAKDAWEMTFDALPIFVTLIDENHRILRINNTMAAHLGKAPSDAVGMRCYQLIHGSTEPPNFCPHSLTMKDGKPHSVEIYEKTLDKWFFVSTVPLFDEEGRLLSSTHVMSDITARKRSELEILASLSEKETLLRELRHRVKNSMALITSLIGLERDQTQNGESRTILDSLKYRISSMETLYEYLHDTGDIVEVKLDNYISSLVDSLVDAFLGDPNSIQIRKNLYSVTVGVNDAAAWGLILNELFTNALKYAFPGGRSGYIRITLEESTESITLSVADNGQGPPPGFSVENSAGFGMNLVRLLAEQLSGGFRFSRGEEYRFVVSAPNLSKPRPRSD